MSHVTPERIPNDVIELCQKLSEQGQRAWVVGGCLRDLCLGRVASDWDLATDARPERVQKIFPKVIPTGIQHGTVTVRHRGRSYEVTTLRGEGAYSDGRRPDSVHFVTDLHEDLARRDFTVNAMAYDPLSHRLEDPFDGLRDLEQGVLRAVGEARQRFSEDGLRVLRAARFCGTLQFELEASTEAAIAPTLETFAKVSAERVRDEWIKALKAPAASRAFAVMKRTGILEVTFPELAALAPARFDGSLAALDRSAEQPGLLRLAALVWPVRELGVLDAWLSRYRYSNQERERVLRLVRYAWPDRQQLADDAAVRRYARGVGRESLADVATLSELLARAHAGEDAAHVASADALRARLATALRGDVALTERELALSGKDLMVELGIKPGPELGALLKALLEAVLDRPEHNTRAGLLGLARAQLESSP